MVLWLSLGLLRQASVAGCAVQFVLSACTRDAPAMYVGRSFSDVASLCVAGNQSVVLSFVSQHSRERAVYGRTITSDSQLNELC